MRESIVEPGRVYRTLSYGPHLDVFMLDERSYRGPNGPNQQTTYGPDAYFIGPDQLLWLKRIRSTPVFLFLVSLVNQWKKSETPEAPALIRADRALATQASSAAPGSPAPTAQAA